MAFDPKTLPPSVYSAYQRGPLAWALVVERAVVSGIDDLNKLTDIVFYLHYPHRIGNPLKPTELDLIAKWKGFRTLIQPRLVQLTRRSYTPFSGIEGTDVGGY